MDEQVIGIGIMSRISADSPMILWGHRNGQPGGSGRRNCGGSGCAGAMVPGADDVGVNMDGDPGMRSWSKCTKRRTRCYCSVGVGRIGSKSYWPRNGEEARQLAPQQYR